MTRVDIGGGGGEIFHFKILHPSPAFVALPRVVPQRYQRPYQHLSCGYRPRRFRSRSVGEMHGQFIIIIIIIIIISSSSSSSIIIRTEDLIR